MGWLEYRATHYKNGKIDRKAEILSQFNNWKNHEVIKSSMVGNVFYGAVKDTQTNQVWALICLTSTRDGFYFAYKDMDETFGPYCYDCPKSILKLLTPIDNDFANEWRKKCYEKHEKKRNKETVGTLPVGSIIEFDVSNETIRLEKRNPAYQFKRPFWYCCSTHKYWMPKHIPSNFRIIQKGA